MFFILKINIKFNLEILFTKFVLINLSYYFLLLLPWPLRISAPNPPRAIGVNLEISGGKKEVKFIPTYDNPKSAIPAAIKMYPIIVPIFKRYIIY